MWAWIRFASSLHERFNVTKFVACRFWYHLANGGFYVPLDVVASWVCFSWFVYFNYPIQHRFELVVSTNNECSVVGFGFATKSRPHCTSVRQPAPLPFSRNIKKSGGTQWLTTPPPPHEKNFSVAANTPHVNHPPLSRKNLQFSQHPAVNKSPPCIPRKTSVRQPTPQK